ncbi:receptor-type tyrosine-protein phosphatase epsilon-like isoform X1 [Pomacea canaliculata]|uniref:receptor-type tyrosine-protein phosphatase epsilon-like isoform X1 n=1 Tax=Pomacea canaliculata TaxID=400727 RepID=UPI000D726AE4|nr:receptor-type tyrosine-protein phosphatase epsilon-like isoform X1 [Pomacea canaliculata]
MWPRGFVCVLVTVVGLPWVHDVACHEVQCLPRSSRPPNTGLSCPEGFWGQTCNLPCNCQGGCDVDTGACGGACLQGWSDGRGTTCSKWNLALNSRSTVTSDPPGTSFPADLVVDGDRHHCINTSTGLKYVDWTVDLTAVHPINSILIVLPEIDQQHALNVWVLLHNGTWHSCGRHLSVSREVIVPCPVAASQVRIATDRHVDSAANMSSDVRLDLCEVEVYACAPGVYGPNCSQVCSGNCHDRQTCDHVTGACAGGCAAGWKHPASGCVTACTPGTYGTGCGQTCGHCKDGEPCDGATGECVKGCEDGYTGISCQEAQVGNQEEDESGISTSGVVGAVAGGSAAFLCCVCIIAHIRRHVKKERAKRQDEEMSAAHQETAAMAGTSPPTNINKNGLRRKSSLFRDRKISIFGERKTSVFGGERRKSIFAAVFGFAKDEDLSSVPVYTNNRQLADSLYDKPTDGVQVDSFRQFVYGKRRGASSLENEFKALPSGFTAPYEEAEKVENKDKNHFSGYYPYDFNRVILRQTGLGDYINASIIKDYKGRDNYIAAQGPDKRTVLSFWHMIWQENVHEIVMLTKFAENKRVKCDRYWSENACVTYGDITVKDTMQMVRATYTIRVLKVMHKKTSEARDIRHFHYTEWPEQATPLVHDLLEFIWRVKASRTDAKGPLLVHCSEGVGRTGTYIAIDSLLQEAEDTGYVDVKTYVERLRHQRKNMVLTKEQYAFVHAALIDGIILGDTRLSAADFCEGFVRDGDQLRVGYRKICEQFHELSYLKSALAFRRDSGIENVTDLRNVSCDGIFMQFVPSTLSANMLRLVDVDSDTDVQKFMLLLRNINALTVVCLHEQDLQIVRRCLEWSKNKIGERQDKQRAREQKKKVGYDSESEDEDDYYLMEELSTGHLMEELSTGHLMEELSAGPLTPVVTANEYRVFVDEYEEMSFLFLSLSGWQQDEKIFSPALVPSVIAMADSIFARQEELGFHPVVLLCGEVQESAGLFCVLCNIVHGIQLEEEVEVYSNVCRVRRLLPEIVTSMEEFLFCHQFAAKYVEAQKVQFAF